MKYDFAAIEKKWQDKWEQVKPYAAVTGDKRPKFYGLIEFPYPSAAGLRVFKSWRTSTISFGSMIACT